MGDVHRLILQHGLEGARSFASTKAERGAIEAAASVLSEEESRLGITHAGFAMTSLPHKRIGEGVWRRDGYRTTLLVPFAAPSTPNSTSSSRSSRTCRYAISARRWSDHFSV
jgi:hypothetical protein